MIEDRLAATLKYDAVNGDSYERNIVAQQIKEAIATIKDLRRQLDDCLNLSGKQFGKEEGERWG